MISQALALSQVAQLDSAVPYLVGDTEAAASVQLGALGLVPSVVVEPRAVNPHYNDEVLAQYLSHATPGGARGPGPPSTDPTGPSVGSGVTGASQ